MNKAMTQSERLTRIETLLETAVATRTEDRAAMRKSIDDLTAKVEALAKKVDEVAADQSALKSKGLGFLAGAGLAGGSVVAALLKAFGA